MRKKIPSSKVMPGEKIKILFIAGAGRSGSTLLGKILGQADGLFHAGEVTQIWQQGFRNNELCSCGKKFRECETWQKIVTKTGEGIEHDLDRIIRKRKPLARGMYLPLQMAGFFRTQKKEFQHSWLVPLYESIRESTGCRIIVDSSKQPAYMGLLTECDNFDLFVIHLVRDSRATVYSSMKSGYKRVEITEKNVMKKGKSAVRASFSWLVSNLATLMVKTRLPRGRYMRVRYEDLAENPRRVTGMILEFAGVSAELGFFTGEKTMEASSGHAVAGNRMRFVTGRIDIKSDDEWKTKLRPAGRLKVNLITYPLLKWFY